MIIYCIATANSILPYERDPIPQDKEPPRFEPKLLDRKSYLVSA